LIVGREAELGAIADFLGGGPAALAFVGEGGIGKTTVWSDYRPARWLIVLPGPSREPSGITAVSARRRPGMPIHGTGRPRRKRLSWESRSGIAAR
jgi:hypothetical protein